jgi:hypothetical protein
MIFDFKIQILFCPDDSELWCLVSGLYWKTQVSSSVITFSKRLGSSNSLAEIPEQISSFPHFLLAALADKN